VGQAKRAHRLGDCVGGHGASALLPTHQAGEEIGVHRHCERSEAIQMAAQEDWIASELALLGMTAQDQKLS
jgi:hypothetical protein